jgi:RNA polymerase sigma-70 factor, ECF subfamily
MANSASRGGRQPMQTAFVEFLELTDSQLVERARGNDHAAFGELVRRHRQKCLNVAASLLRNDGEIEDQVQIALLKAYRHLHQYQGEAEFSTWLARIVFNQSLILMRGRRRIRLLYLDDVPYRTAELLVAPHLDPESELASRQLRQVLVREVGLIPEVLRSVMLLRDVRGLPIADVAARLGISVPAAKSRLVRARREVRLRMARHYRRPVPVPGPRIPCFDRAGQT